MRIKVDGQVISEKTVECGRYIFTTIKRNSKRGQEIYRAYQMAMKNYSYHNDIHKAYSKPSAEKEFAWKQCQRMKRQMSGEGLVIIGYNCFQFSAAFKAEIDGCEALIYITVYDNYIVW